MNENDPIERLIVSARDERAGRDPGWSSFVNRAHRALFLRRVAAAGGAVALIGIGVAGAALVRAPAPAPGDLAPANNPTRETTEPSPKVKRSPSPSPPAPSPSPTEEEGEPLASFEAEVWFVDGERLVWGTQIVTPDRSVTDPKPELVPGLRTEAAIEALLAGPSAAVVEAGHTTAVPEGVELLGLDLFDTVATVNLSREFESGGGSLAMQLRLMQLVYTTTQFDADRVVLQIEGETVDAFGGEGLLIPPEGLTRRDFKEVAPPIVLEEPEVGSEVSRSFTVAGFANVFEANVNIRIVDGSGKVLKETFVTATCGSGCWGDFTKRIKLGDIGEPQQIRVEVLTYSAEDGSPQDRISIPVTLLP